MTRTVKVSVMVDPEINERLDKLARQRKGRAAKSSAINDILVDFFARLDREIEHDAPKKEHLEGEPA